MSDRLKHARQLLQKTQQGWSQSLAHTRATFTLGVEEIERNLSHKSGFSASVHELYTQTGCGGRDVYALFLAHLFLKSDDRIIFWISPSNSPDYGQLYPLSLPPTLRQRLHIVRPRRPNDVLWSFEECLASRQAAVVIAEVSHLDLLSSRRLQLACEKGKSLGLALCQNSLGLRQSSAARTRWRVCAAPHKTWKLELLGGHGVRTGCWNVTYDETTFSLSVVSPPRHRPLHAH